MANFAQIHGSVNPINDAVWVDDTESNARFLIAPADTPSATTALLKNMKIHQELDPDKTMWDDKQETYKIISEFILLDWENVEDEYDVEVQVEVDGKKTTETTIELRPVEYSIKNAMELFAKYPLFAAFIDNEATLLKEKREVEKAKAKKKSKK